MSVQRPSRIVWWLRATIVVGALLIATGVGGMVFEARRKVAAIDCLSGASPASSWDYERHGSESIRSFFGDRGTLMFLDSPRALSYHDVFSKEQADALRELPTLRRILIRHAYGLDAAPAEHIARLHTDLPDCDIICWRSDGTTNWQWDWERSEWTEFLFSELPPVE